VLTAPHGRNLIKAVAARGALLVLGCAAGLVLLEGVARLLPEPVSAYTGRGLYLPDADIGHVLAPNVQSGSVRTNALGLRDRDYPAHKPAGGYRILGIGDSHTFGGEGADEVYLDILEDLLARPAGPPVEVINAGVPAYSTVQELQHLRRLEVSLAPDLVILGLFPTGDVIENWSDEHLEVVDGELTSRSVSRAERRLLRWHLYRLIRRRLVVHADDGGMGRARFLEVERDRLQTCLLKPPRHVEGGYRRTEDLLRQMRDALAPRGMRLVVLVVPDEFQVDDALYAETVRFSGRPPGEYDRDLPTRRLTRVLDDLGVPVVDVTEALRVRARQERVYRNENTHWNAAGHRRAAEVLAERLRALVPPLQAAGAPS
jgi:lysophospholipase L1-like esterase